MISIFGFDIVGTVVILGAITGMIYGVLAVGLVLIYRSNRIINFAHGEIGALGAAVLGVTVVRLHLPYWVAFAGALTLSGCVGALAEVAVIRRLRRAPNLMSVVATLGMAQFLLLFSLVLNSQVRTGRVFPQPTGFPQFNIGALRVTPAYFGMLALTPVLVLGLVLFLRYSWYGIAIRGAASNPESARLSGVFPGRMSTLSWAIAGAVSAFTAILISPTRGFITFETLGPSLLLRALAAAVIARMRSLPIALGAGLGVGIVEQELLWNYPRGGFVEAVLFGLILLALLVRRRQGAREEERGSWAVTQPWPPLLDVFRRVWAIRNLGGALAVAGLILAIVLGVVVTNSAAIILVAIISFALVGLSIGVISGLGGQLSLGQFALAGIGATASYYIASRTGSYLLGFVGAGIAAALVSALIGIPALRIRGLMLGVTTLSFALAAQVWLLYRPWMLGDGVDPGRPNIGPFALDTGRKYYFFALAVLAAGLWLARNVWRGGLGRRLRALRDNEDGARAFTVPAIPVKLQAFALAGFLSGLGGAVYGHALSRISAAAFPIGASVSLVAMSVLGGIGLLVGPLLGALYIIGIPRFLPLDSAGLAATAFGWLALILFFPGGIAQMLRPIRERLVDFLARQSGLDPESIRSVAVAARIAEAAPAGGVRLLAASTDRAGRAGGVLLEGWDLRKHFGGVRAVDGVSFTVTSGEMLGLIGPNGAGKTTLFELVAGFTRPDAGRVVFSGRDISRLGPEARGRLGLIRSFQDASLFPTLTVLECVEVALERTDPTRLFPSVAGLVKAERKKEERARELVHLMGLDDYRDKQVMELSTGTRRITELCCLVALEPKLLLLDEPSSGIAQRETESLGDVLIQVKEHLGATMLVIEHDMPLIMGLSNRIVAMESGRIIAEGTPEQVRNAPIVIESYLGGDVAAIARSSAVTATDGRCRAMTRSGSQCSKRAGPAGYCTQHSLQHAPR